MSSASTGGTEGSSPASSPASGASLTMAPKYGTLVPNRIFVGGISASTTEAELAQAFSVWGNVKATKIISDRAGVSKGYGFVTFETEEEAKRLQQEADCIVLRERKLNIAPAIKKQPFSRSFDGSPPSVPTSTYYYANGMGIPYQNGGVTFYNTAAPAPATSIGPPTDPGTFYQAGVFGPQAATGHQAYAPMMYPCPPSLYVPQQYQFQPIPYEPYYAGTAAAGAPQYLYATTGSSPNNSSSTGNGSNSSSSGGTNGTGATSPPTGPPPLPPPHPSHYYAPAAPPPPHHPPVPAGPPPPQAQVDHLYYPFATGPHPAPPPHAPMGLTEQQLLLYTPDATSCQTSTSDSQTVPQEDSRSTANHSEQPHSDAQQTATGSPATPLVPLMPVKFPGRYANYQIAITHTPQNDSSEDCAVGRSMNCRILYPLYFPHAHAPPPYAAHHNASGTTSLLPTPSQSYDTGMMKTHGHNNRDCGNKYTGGQGNTSRGQNHSYQLAHQNAHAKNTQNGAQLYNKCGGNVTDGLHKYSMLPMSSRLPVQYNRRSAGSNVGSSTVLRSGGGYGHKVTHTSSPNYGGSQQSGNANVHSYEHATNGRAKNNDHYYEVGAGNNKYGSGRKNCSSNNNNNNNYRGGVACLDVLGSDNNNSRSNTDASQTDNTVIIATTTTTTTTTTLSSHLSSTERTNVTQEKPTSPPPAPYSPMTRPLPNLSPPTPQVQFYPPTQNRYQPPSSMPPSQSQQQQQPQQQQQSGQRGRYSVGQSLSSAARKPSDKYSSSTGSQATMLRQSKYKQMNSITATTTVTNKLAEDTLGGAGDGPSRLPITPPGTPRASGHPAAGDQLGDTCHQMQALAL